jgi:uncharacterized protein (TIGR00251 family)
MNPDVTDLYEERDGAVLLSVHAQPGAGRSAVTGRHGDALKAKVAAPPADGRANRALISLLAETFGVAPAQVTLVSGETSRVKRFRLEGVDLDHFASRLEQVIAAADAAAPGRGSRPAR